jgi:hypothetical protein
MDPQVSLQPSINTAVSSMSYAEQNFNFTDLPVEVIFQIFFQLGRQNLKQATIFPQVCKTWQLKAHETPLYRLFISQKYPNIDLKKFLGDDFEKVFIFSNRMMRMAYAFAEANLNLLTYNTYKKQLFSLLEEYKAFLPLTPYFDLRPFAWLDRDSWVKYFNHIAPLLKNVQVLEISGMGTKIRHASVKLPHIPVLSKVSKVSKFIFKGLVEHAGVDVQAKDKEVVNKTLVLCIAFLGKISANLTTLNGANTSLSYQEFKWIKEKFPNIKVL